jgi:3-hydroxymyristoyl/3-hydroxydecanoyl-(acyl carrier protein) dehydratase
MIQHTVAFNLKHAAGSAEEIAFLAAADVLIGILGVQQFKKSRQISPKNKFRFNFSMMFADQAAYDFYNTHADHVAFVQNRWIPEVAEFLEADFVDLVL